MSLLKTKDVAAQLNCSETFVLDLARSGAVRALKMGSHWRFRQSDIDAYLRGSEYKPPATNDVPTVEPAPVPGLPILDSFAKRKGIKL